MIYFTNEERKMLAESMGAYADLDFFADLVIYIKNDMKLADGEKRYIIHKCQKCKKYFIVERLEIINKHLDCFRDDIPLERDWRNPNLCRECGKWSYDNIIDVNYEENIPQILLIESILNRYLHGEKITKEEYEKIILLAGGINRKDIAYLYQEYRSIKNMLLYSECSDISDLFWTVVKDTIAMDRNSFLLEIGKIKHLKQDRTLINKQHNKNIANMIQQLSDSYKNGILDVLYPRMNQIKKEEIFAFEEIKISNIKMYLDIYKDLYDLKIDHMVIGFICNSYKSKKVRFDESAIADSDYGKKLIERTYESAKDTPLEQLICSVYNNNIRRGIGHGAYAINEETKIISFFNNGVIAYEDTIENILLTIEKLIYLHMEIQYLLDFSYVWVDEEYFYTSGIYCIKPSLESGEPMITILQASPFWKKSILSGRDLSEIYKVCLGKVVRDGENGISLSITKSGLECEGDEKRTKLCCTGYIKEWIREVVKEGHIEVILQQVMQQSDAVKQSYGGIEYEIPIDELGEERMMLTGLIESVDYQEISDDKKKELQSIYIPIKKQQRNELCSCGSGRKFKKCCGRFK